MLPRISPPKEDLFMGILMVASAACKDPIFQQSALLVDHKDCVVTIAHNTLMEPDYLNGSKKAWTEYNREILLVTAVERAIQHSLKEKALSNSTFGILDRHTIYTTGPITHRDVRAAYNTGLKKIIYGPITPKDFDQTDWEKTIDCAKVWGCHISPYKGNLNWVRDRIDSVSDLF